MDKLHAFDQLRLLVLGGRDERPLEVIEDRQQVLDKTFVRKRDEVGPLACSALAEVVEVRRDALQLVLESGEALVLAALLGRGLLGLRLLDARLVRHYDVFASSSITS